MSPFGKTKGFIFTLDTIIAAFILIIVLFLVHFFTARAVEDKLAIIQPLNTVSDTITFLELNGTLQTHDKTLIQNGLQATLPQNINTRIQLSYSANTTTIDLGTETPSGVFVATGKRYFWTGSDYGVARFWVWPRE